MSLSVRFVVGDPLKIKCDALICAEDTMQIMSPHRVISGIMPTEQQFKQVLTKAIHTKPLPIGTFMIEDHPQHKNSTLVRVVVYDFSNKPTADKDSIKKALLDVLRWLDRKNFSSVALSAIGAGHGGVGFGQWGKIFGEMLSNFVKIPAKTLNSITIAEEDAIRLTQIRLGFASVPGTEKLRTGA